MEKADWIFYGCLAANLFMFGVICFVQLVHYPSFLHIRKEDWREFHTFHSRRTSWVVAAPIALQVFCTLLLHDKSIPLYVFTALAIGTTFLISVPLHQKLSNQHNLRDIQLLILSNWIRVFGWGGSSFILIEQLLLSKQSY